MNFVFYTICKSSAQIDCVLGYNAVHYKYYKYGTKHSANYRSKPMYTNNGVPHIIGEGNVRLIGHVVQDGLINSWFFVDGNIHKLNLETNIYLTFSDFCKMFQLCTFSKLSKAYVEFYKAVDIANIILDEDNIQDNNCDSVSEYNLDNYIRSCGNFIVIDNHIINKNNIGHIRINDENMILIYLMNANKPMTITPEAADINEVFNKIADCLK